MASPNLKYPDLTCCEDFKGFDDEDEGVLRADAGFVTMGHDELAEFLQACADGTPLPPQPTSLPLLPPQPTSLPLLPPQPTSLPPLPLMPSMPSLRQDLMALLALLNEPSSTQASPLPDPGPELPHRLDQVMPGWRQELGRLLYCLAVADRAARHWM